MSNLDITCPRGLDDSTRKEHVENLQRRQTCLRARVRRNILEDKLSLPDVVSYTVWKPVKRVLSLPQSLCLNASSISQSKRKVGLLSLPNETLVMIYGYLDAEPKASFSFSCRALLIAASLHSRLVWVSRSHLLNIITPREHHSRHCAGCDRMRPIHSSYWNEPLDRNADVRSILRWLIKAFESEQSPAYLTTSNCDASLAAAQSNLVRSWTSQDFGSSPTTSEIEACSSRSLQCQDQDVQGQRFCPNCIAQRRCEDAKLRESMDKDAIYQCFQRAADGFPVSSWDSRTVSILLSFEMMNTTMERTSHAFSSLSENLSVVRSDMKELNSDTEKLVTKVGGLGSDARELVSDVKELSSDAKELASDSQKLSGGWAGLASEAEPNMGV